MNKYLIFLIFVMVSVFIMGTRTTEAKSYIKSYSRSSGIKVKSYVRYKADGYRFNNYVYGPDRGYRR